MLDSGSLQSLDSKADGYFAEHPIMAVPEEQAIRDGLKYIDELIIEEGGIYKGYIIYYKNNRQKMKSFLEMLSKEDFNGIIS